jgi:hypothetical protein
MNMTIFDGTWHSYVGGYKDLLQSDGTFDNIVVTQASLECYRGGVRINGTVDLGQKTIHIEQRGVSGVPDKDFDGGIVFDGYADGKNRTIIWGHWKIHLRNPLDARDKDDVVTIRQQTEGTWVIVKP